MCETLMATTLYILHLLSLKSLGNDLFLKVDGFYLLLSFVCLPSICFKLNILHTMYIYQHSRHRYFYIVADE